MDSDTETQNDIRELEAALQDSDNEASLPDSVYKYMVEVQGPKISVINSALVLNQQLDAKYAVLEELLLKRLSESKKKSSEVKQELANLNKRALVNNTGKKFPYTKLLGRYFKSKTFGMPPENSDTILIRESKMINIFQMQRCKSWTPKDKKKLSSVILKMSQNLRKNDLTKHLNQLKREGFSDGNIVENIQKEYQMQEIRNEIVQLPSKTLGEIAYSIDYEYDWDMVANEMNGIHNAHECRSYWKLYLHPSINKDDWSKRETNKLSKLVEEHNSQDWDTIAAKLGTGRSAFQCFVYFRTLLDKKQSTSWSEEEDEYLKRVIEYCRCGDFIPWNRVTYYIENKTKMQVYNRWTFCLEPQIKKGRFLPEEDAVLSAFVNKYGKDFPRATALIPGRTAAQLRIRYNLSLLNLKTACWTVEEDKRLLQLIDDKPHPKLFSSVEPHFPGKNRSSIRIRYRTLQKWITKYPNEKIEYAPRRKEKLLDRNKDMDLKTAVEKLRQRLTGLVDEDKTARQIKNVDRRIANYFLTELNDEKMKDTESNEQISIINLKTILQLLGANLNKDKFDLVAKSMDFDVSSLKENIIVPVTNKVKTYSRKSSQVQFSNCSNIWEGTVKFSDNVYFPPNYSTMVALKTLFLKKSEKNYLRESHNLDIMYNPYFVRFFRRFESLFRLTMILSNVMPKKQITSLQTVFDDENKSNVTLEEYSDILKEARKVNADENNSISRKRNHKQFKDEINENIDLNHADDSTTIEINFGDPCDKDTPKDIPSKKKRHISESD